MRIQALEGGFAEPSVDAARAFRAAMRAMARPGTIEQAGMARPPAPASSAAGMLLLTLCDPDTPVHLAGEHDSAALCDWITFHTAAPVIGPKEARFALGSWDALLPLSQYAGGTPEYPDRSATLIVEMEALAPAGTGLTGPGIRDRAELSLPDPDALRANAARFPMGLDFFLTCGDRLAALPRSTRLEDAPCT